MLENVVTAGFMLSCLVCTCFGVDSVVKHPNLFGAVLLKVPPLSPIPDIPLSLRIDASPRDILKVLVALDILPLVVSLAALLLQCKTRFLMQPVQ